MFSPKQDLGLALVNGIMAKDKSTFTFDEARQYLERSSGATANVLRRLRNAGLVDRVRHGHYAIRSFGMLDIPAAVEDTSLAVGAAFKHRVHRIGYRSALDEHSLITHPTRSIHVAAAASIRAKSLWVRPLHVVLEPKHIIGIGAKKLGESWVSDLERTLLDCAHRPNLVGGVGILVEAVYMAQADVDVDKLMRYARTLNWASAIRRIGSLADALEMENLSNALKPIRPVRSDLELEPGCEDRIVWRDHRWHLRWRCRVDELTAITNN